MPQISAANNLTVTFDEDDWRLYNGQTDGTPPMVQAKPDGLTYQPPFATARRLDPSGHLAAADISTVVVGWAEEDTSWHLGLLLTPEIARARGGRWCGVARWNTPGSTDAERAGSALASTLDVPFRFVPPAEMTAASTALANGAAATTGAAGAIAAPPLAAQPVGLYSDTTGGTPFGETPMAPLTPPVPAVLPLPIEIGDWLLRADARGLVWERARAWRRKTLIYAIVALVLGILFGLLSLGAKLSQFAAVQPDWLPLVGIFIAVLMLIVAVVQGMALLTAVSVLIDTSDRFVRLMQGGRISFQIPYEGIEYVLASHILSRREVAGETAGFTYDHIWPDVWLHLFSPRRGFILVGDMTPTEGRALAGVSFAERHPLNLAEIDTPAHHAALIIAQAIGVPVYVEERRGKDAANG